MIADTACVPNLFLTSDLTTIYRPKRTVEGMNWKMPRFLLSFLFALPLPPPPSYHSWYFHLTSVSLGVSFPCVPGRSMSMQADGRGGYEAKAEKADKSTGFFFSVLSHAVCAQNYCIHAVVSYLHTQFFRPIVSSQSYTKNVSNRRPYSMRTRSMPCPIYARWPLNHFQPPPPPSPQLWKGLSGLCY
jgi:hypothetical protein